MMYWNNNRTVGALLALFGLALLLSCSAQESDKAGSGKQENAASESASGDSLTIALTGEDSISVFDLLKRSHQVDSWSTAVGVFVNGIDSMKNGPRVFWIYSVNDSMPDIASDRKITKAGDKVVWHFRRLR